MRYDSYADYLLNGLIPLENPKTLKGIIYKIVEKIDKVDFMVYRMMQAIPSNLPGTTGWIHSLAEIRSENERLLTNLSEALRGLAKLDICVSGGRMASATPDKYVEYVMTYLDGFDIRIRDWGLQLEDPEHKELKKWAGNRLPEARLVCVEIKELVGKFPKLIEEMQFDYCGESD